MHNYYSTLDYIILVAKMRDFSNTFFHSGHITQFLMSENKFLAESFGRIQIPNRY